MAVWFGCELFPSNDIDVSVGWPRVLLLIMVSDENKYNGHVMMLLIYILVAPW